MFATHRASRARRKEPPRVSRKRLRLATQAFVWTCPNQDVRLRRVRSSHRLRAPGAWEELRASPQTPRRGSPRTLFDHARAHAHRRWPESRRRREGDGPPGRFTVRPSGGGRHRRPDHRAFVATQRHEGQGLRESQGIQTLRRADSAAVQRARRFRLDRARRA